MYVWSNYNLINQKEFWTTLNFKLNKIIKNLNICDLTLKWNNKQEWNNFELKKKKECDGNKKFPKFPTPFSSS